MKRSNDLTAPGKRTGALWRYHFHYMKWFFLIQLLIAGIAGWSVFLDCSSFSNTLWNAARPYQSANRSFGSILHSAIFYGMIYQSMVAVATALVQQFFAHNPRNALMLATTPYTRKTQLRSELMIGILSYTLPLLVLLLSTLVCLFSFHGNLSLAARISFYPAFDAQQITPWMAIVPIFRAWVFITFVYAVVHMLSGLFGNMLMSLAVVALVGVLGFSTMNGLGEFLYALGAVHTPLDPQSVSNAIYPVLRTVIDTGLASLAPYGSWLPASLPWDIHFIRMLLVFLPLIALCFLACFASRKHLPIEKLSGLFLYDSSRHVLSALITALPALLILYNYSDYQYPTHTYSVSPLMPYFVGIVALVYLVCFFVFVRKRGKRRRGNARALALLLVACFLLTSAVPGQADPEYAPDEDIYAEHWYGKLNGVDFEYDASALTISQEEANRFSKLDEALSILLNDPALNPDISADPDNWDTSEWYSISSYAKRALQRSKVGAELEHRETIELMGSFEDTFAQTSIKASSPLIGHFPETLRGAGFPLLAKDFESAVALGDEHFSALYYEDGIWMRVDREKYSDDSSPDEKLMNTLYGVYFYISNPLTLRSYGASLDALEKDTSFRRVWAHSNGKAESVGYALHRIGSATKWLSSGMMTAIGQSGRFDTLLINLPKDMSAEEITRHLAAVGEMLIASDVPPADAQDAVSSVTKLMTEKLKGSAERGVVHWSVAPQRWGNSSIQALIEVVS